MQAYEEMQRVYRVQDQDGRGPFKPGFSHKWIDPIDLPGQPPMPPPWFEEFPDIFAQFEPGFHYGTAVRNIKDLGNWFSRTECERLGRLGYAIVGLFVDKILAESENQLIFARKRPLNQKVWVLRWRAMREPKGPRKGAHAAHGTVGRRIVF